MSFWMKFYAAIRFFTKICKQNRINAYAAQAAFFMLLSIIPFLMVFSSLLQYTSISEGMLLKIITRIMPEYIAPFLVSVVDEVYNRSVGIISVTAVAAVWSAAKGIQALNDGLNAVNDVDEQRNWLVQRFWAVVYIVVFMLAIVMTLVILVFGNSLSKFVAEYVPILSHTMEFLSRFRGLWMLAALVIFFDILFTTLPNRKLTLKGQLPGAAVCGVAWYVFSFGLSIYVNYFNGFSMYGSLTTIALIMLWLYFCMYIMFVSAEINVLYLEDIRRWRKRRKRKKQQ